MSETLTDEQILGIDDSPASEVSRETDASGSAPIESQQEQAGEETQFERPEAQAQAKPQADRTQQPAKPQDKTQQGDKPATTPEQAQEVTARKAEQLDRADAAFANGDTEGMVATLTEMFDGNPGGEAQAIRVGLMHLEQASPEHFASLVSMFQSGFLASSGVTWNTLEKIADALEKAGDRETLEKLNNLALIYRQSGLGPVTPEAQSQAISGYNETLGKMLDRDVPAAIAKAFGPKFNSLHPQDRQAVLETIKLDIRDRLLNDKAVTAAYEQLTKSFSEKEASRIYYEVLEPKFLSLARMLAANYAKLNFEYVTPPRPQTTQRPAPNPAQPAPQRPRSMAEATAKLGTSMQDVYRAFGGEPSSGSYLPQDEANAMSDREILDSTRVPLTRKPWRPESIFDEGGQ